MNIKRPVVLRVLTVLCVSGLLFSAAGCTTLRKKFIRQKKKERKQRFIPVLEPVDYAPREVSPRQAYKEHYMLWKVWHKDLQQKVAQDNDKRAQYLITQCVTQLEKMQSLVSSEENKESLGGVLAQYRSLNREFDKSSSMRNMTRIKGKLFRLEKQVRNNFGSEQVEELVEE